MKVSQLRVPKSKLITWPTLSSKFSNPKALYATNTLRSLYITILSHPDRSLQNVFLSYRSTFLAPYEERLRALLDETRWRDAIWMTLGPVTGNPRVFLGPPTPTPTWNLYLWQWVWEPRVSLAGYPVTLHITQRLLRLTSVLQPPLYLLPLARYSDPALQVHVPQVRVPQVHPYIVICSGACTPGECTWGACTPGASVYSNFSGACTPGASVYSNFSGACTPGACTSGACTSGASVYSNFSGVRCVYLRCM